MSWILRHKRFFSFLSLIIWLLCLLFIKVFFSQFLIVFVVFSVIVFIFLFVNEIIYRKFKRQREIFDPTSKIRNFDTLVIGDNIVFDKICDTKKDKCLLLSSYKRSLKSSFEILKSTHSILKDVNSEVIFVLNVKYIKNNDFSLFDVFFFNNITINMLGITNLQQKQRFPLFFAPLESLFNLMPLKQKELNLSKESYCEEIRLFCKERGYKFRLYLFE